MRFTKLYFIFFILFIGCKIDESDIISPISFKSIEISEIEYSPKEINSDTIFVNGKISPSDEITIDLKISFKSSSLTKPNDFKISVYENNTNSTLYSTYDTKTLINGNSTIHQTELKFKFLRSFIGKLFLNISSPNSNSHILPINIYRGNVAPEILTITLADSIKLNDKTQIVPIYVSVKDDNGLSDIKNVKFNSIRLPDSTTIRGIFELFDDGGLNGDPSNIDVTPGDGIYSLAIQLPSTTIRATYRFQFYATDKSNSVSKFKNKEIVIY